MKLFEDEFQEDNSPLEDTQITTTLLYFSEEELKQFKAQCKEGMRRMFGNKVITEGNLSDFLLRITKEYNEKNSSQEISNTNTGGSTIS